MLTREQQAARDEERRTWLREVYDATGLVQQTTMNHPNLRMDRTIHGDDIRYQEWCEAEAARIRSDKTRRAEVRDYNGKCALFVDNNTDTSVNFDEE